MGRRNTNIKTDFEKKVGTDVSRRISILQKEEKDNPTKMNTYLHCKIKHISVFLTFAHIEPSMFVICEDAKDCDFCNNRPSSTIEFINKIY